MFWWLVTLYCPFKLLLWYFYFFLTKPEGKLSIEKKMFILLMNLVIPLHNQANDFFETLVWDSRAMPGKTAFRKSKNGMM